MSRDWTPRELWYADEMAYQTRGERLRDTKLVYVIDGKQIPIDDKQSEKIRSQYKELGFLFDKLLKLYKELSDHPKYRNRVLNQIEEHLELLIKQNNGSEKDIVWLWYIGKLDKNFYYREYNDELFYEYIVNEVNKLIFCKGK